MASQDKIASVAETQSQTSAQDDKKPLLRKKGEKKVKGVVHLHLTKDEVGNNSVLSIHADFDEKVSVMLPDDPDNNQEYTVKGGSFKTTTGQLLSTTILTYNYVCDNKGEKEISRSYQVNGEFDFITVRFVDVHHCHPISENDDDKGLRSNHVSSSTVYYGGAE